MAARQADPDLQPPGRRVGQVKPGAKAVDAKAAVALPVHGGEGVRAVVGLAWADERDLPDPLIDGIARDAESMP